MLYHVRIPDGECRTLAAIKGREIEMLTTDSWSVEIQTSVTTISIQPEEVATPDDQHPVGDVVRPQVIELTASRFGNDGVTLSPPNGRIREIRIVSTLVSFSPIEKVHDVEIVPGVILPESEQYGFVYYDDTERQLAIEKVAANQALVDLDIGIEFVTEDNSNLVLYTRGFFVCVSLIGLPDEEWVKFNAFSRRPL